MPSKYTPGSWIVKDWTLKGGDGSIDFGQNDANRFLIAAAPDLLEACEFLIRELVIEAKGRGMADTYIPLAVTKAREAIAKARGELPQATEEER